MPYSSPRRRDHDQAVIEITSRQLTLIVVAAIVIGVGLIVLGMLIERHEPGIGNVVARLDSEDGGSEPLEPLIPEARGAAGGRQTSPRLDVRATAEPSAASSDGARPAQTPVAPGDSVRYVDLRELATSENPAPLPVEVPSAPPDPEVSSPAASAAPAPPASASGAATGPGASVAPPSSSPAAPDLDVVAEAPAPPSPAPTAPAAVEPPRVEPLTPPIQSGLPGDLAAVKPSSPETGLLTPPMADAEELAPAASDALTEAPQPASSPDGGYYGVQVAAIAIGRDGAAQARRKAADYIARNPALGATAVESSDGKWIRIIAGRYADKAAANRRRAELITQPEYKGCFVQAAP